MVTALITRPIISTVTLQCLHSGFRIWKDTVQPAFDYAAVDYKDVLVVHGNKADGFCYDAEKGAMHAFGERTPGADNGYGYCRGGETASKRLHIYVLLG